MNNLINTFSLLFSFAHFKTIENLIFATNSRKKINEFALSDLRRPKRVLTRDINLHMKSKSSCTIRYFQIFFLFVDFCAKLTFCGVVLFVHSFPHHLCRYFVSDQALSAFEENLICYRFRNDLVF